jgi:hypothetical protein
MRLSRLVASLAVGVVLVSPAYAGMIEDAAAVKRSAVQFSETVDSVRKRVFDLEYDGRSAPGQPSPLTAAVVRLCMRADRLAFQAKQYELTVSFIDLDYCKETLAEIYPVVRDLRREALKLPARNRKGLLKDVRVSFQRVDAAIHGGTARYPIPRDPELDD